MPTCSQAKIITNLESDIHKRLFELTNINVTSKNSQSSSSSSSGSGTSSKNYLSDESPSLCDNHNLQSSLNNNKYYNKNGITTNKESLKLQHYNNNQLFYYPQPNLLDIRKKAIYELVKPSQLENSSFISKTRRQSVVNYEKQKQYDQLSSNCCEMPPIVQHKKHALINTIDRRDSVPVNFSFNSHLRSNLKNERISNAHLIFKNKNTNNCEEIDDEMLANSSDLNSENSNLTLPEILSSDIDKLKKNEKIKDLKKDFTQYVLNHHRSKRNSFDSDISNSELNYKNRFNSYSNHNLSSYFANFPKLALEVEAIEQYSNSLANMDQNSNILKTSNDIDYSESRKFSVNQAKRLLALASIRPSKTFHKTMTDEEVVILKKYYEEIKPKSLSNMPSSNKGMTQLEIEKLKYESFPPILYDSAKVNFLTLNKLKNFIDTHKKDIEEGILGIDFDFNRERKEFFLKDVKSNEKVIQFPDELNDSFLALASVSSSDKESQLIKEANLYRIINWNDTVVSSFNHKSEFINTKFSKKSKSKLNKKDLLTSSQNYLLSPSILSTNTSNLNLESTTTSVHSFDFIKTLSSLVCSIIEPKLLKQITFTGVDVGVLPGGKNFEMPTFEEMGIDLNILLKNHISNSNNCDQITNLNNKNQATKLKLSTIKKLKDKVNSSKVMWFSSPPERKPLSVIFEIPNSNKIDHETILNQTNDSLKQIGGYIESLELIPRSVQFGSVYVEDLWILTLNSMNTKFYTITNGIKINDENLIVKSYDDFIFSEYERFIRNEKYKKIIKNHEKSLSSKISINYNQIQA